MGESGDKGQQLAIRVAVASLTAVATLASPDAGAAVTALGPLAEAVTGQVAVGLNRRRLDHASETLNDAAEASRDTLEEFVQKALSDDRRSELLARTLFIAQDTALRQKRCALGRALAGGIAGDDAKIDEELFFIRAIADIDTPHIRVLALLASPRELTADAGQGWRSPVALAATGAQHPGHSLARLTTLLNRAEISCAGSGKMPLSDRTQAVGQGDSSARSAR